MYKYRSGPFSYRLYIRTDTFCVSAAVIILRTVQYGPTISNGTAAWRDKTSAGRISGRSSAESFYELALAIRDRSSDYVGIWITLRFSRFLAVERKLRRNEHCASRNAHSDTCTGTFVAEAPKLLGRKERVKDATAFVICITRVIDFVCIYICLIRQYDFT